MEGNEYNKKNEHDKGEHKKWIYPRVYFVFECDRGSYIVVGRNTVVYSHIHSSWGISDYFFLIRIEILFFIKFSPFVS